MNCIADIDAAISAADLDESAVAREAGLEPRYLFQIRKGRRPLTLRTINRVRLAIAELRRQKRLSDREKTSGGQKPWESRSAAQYRIAIVYVASVCGVTPRFILDADPAKRATADPQWLRAAQLRRIALYIANQYLFVPQADLARAASMSKANVCYALKDIEDQRGDSEIERVISTVEEAFQ